MALHVGFKVFRIESSGDITGPELVKMVDLHCIPENKIPNPFTDFGAAEQWLKNNGGKGVDSNHTILEVRRWDYE